MTNGASSFSGGLAGTTFFSRTFDEVYTLLTDARDYMAVAETIKWEEPILGLVHSQESLRVTARVTHIMAWLMAQRAVHAGEISREESREGGYRLERRQVCIEAGGETSPSMPAELRELLERSRKLYMRVMRLDEMVDRDVPRPALPFESISGE